MFEWCISKLHSLCDFSINIIISFVILSYSATGREHEQNMKKFSFLIPPVDRMHKAALCRVRYQNIFKFITEIPKALKHFLQQCFSSSNWFHQMSNVLEKYQVLGTFREVFESLITKFHLHKLFKAFYRENLKWSFQVAPTERFIWGRSNFIFRQSKVFCLLFKMFHRCWVFSRQKNLIWAEKLFSVMFENITWKWNFWLSYTHGWKINLIPGQSQFFRIDVAFPESAVWNVMKACIFSLPV